MKCISRFKLNTASGTVLIPLLFLFSLFLTPSNIVAESQPTPSMHEIQSWGYTWNEFAELVRERHALELEGRDLNRWFTNSVDTRSKARIYHSAVRDIEIELYSRRAAVYNLTPEQFRQKGLHIRMLKAARRGNDELALSVRVRHREVKTIQKARTRQVKPPMDGPGDKTRVRGAVNERGQVPLEQQPSSHRKGTAKLRPDEAPPAGQQNTLRQRGVSGGDGIQAQGGSKPSLRERFNEVAEKHKEQAAGFFVVAANLETIIDCANEGVSAQDCLAQITVQNGFFAGTAMATQVLSKGALIKLELIGGFLGYVKLTYDTAEILYNFQSWASAEYERYRIEQDREKWVLRNLDAKGLDNHIETLRSRVKTMLEPAAAKMDAGCRQIKRILEKAETQNHSIRKEHLKFPSPATIAVLQKNQDKNREIAVELRQFRKQIDKIEQTFDKFKQDLEAGDAAASGCNTQRDAQTILDHYQAAKSKLAAIEKLIDGCDRIARTLKPEEVLFLETQTMLRNAFAVRDRISDLAAGIPSSQQIEEAISSIQSASQILREKGVPLSAEVKALRLAYPDDLDHAAEYRIYELQKLIFELQNINHCETGDTLKLYNLDAGEAVNAKLEVENRLRPLKALYAELEEINMLKASDHLSALCSELSHARLMMAQEKLSQKADCCLELARTGNSKESLSKCAGLIEPDTGDGTLQPGGSPTVGFEKLAYEVHEDAGAAVVNVRRRGDMTFPLEVQWKIYDSDTTMDRDYKGVFGQLSWLVGESGPKKITVHIIDDQDAERLEHAYIELYNAQVQSGRCTIDSPNPAKLFILDNDIDEEEKKLAKAAGTECLSMKILPDKISAEPGQAIDFDRVFRVIALMDDLNEVDVTLDPRTTWAPGRNYTFPQKSSFNERLEVKVGFLGCQASARIDAQYPFWSPPISDPRDLSAQAPKPPADAYVWYVVCDKQYYDVVYTEHVDLTRDVVIAGPFPGPREPAMWIEANCPRAKCNKAGKCSQDTAVRGGPWGVYCNINTGLIVVTKGPQIHHRKLEGDFQAVTEGQLWVDQHYPSWLCDNHGGYVEGGFSELSSNVGKPKKYTKEKSEFAEIGGESTRKILRESSDATRMSYGGMKGFSLHNFDNSIDDIMGKGFRQKREAQKKEAQQFLNEFLTRTTNDFYEYQKKRVAQKQPPPKTGNYQSNGTGAPDKNYINNLKCKNAKPYLKNAIKVKNLKYAREILNEIKIAKCDYYSNAKAEVDKLENLLARQNACDHYGGEIQDALRRKNISSAKYNLEKFKGCPNYEPARAAVAKMEYDTTHTKVPNVVGMEYKNGRDKISSASLHSVLKLGTDIKVERDPRLWTIERQSPAPGSIVKRWTDVTIWYVHTSHVFGTGF